MCFIGFIFMVNYFSGVTGYVINENIKNEFNSVFSITCIVAGLSLFILGRHIKENKKIIVNRKKGLYKMKIAFLTKKINYDSLKKLVQEIGYNFVETKDYAVIFSDNEKIIKNNFGDPLKISYNKKEDRKLLLEIIESIIKNIN